MMKSFNVLTTFPQIFEALNYSIVKKAIDSGFVETNILNIRDYANNKNKNTDDYPYGGGLGMIMTCQPIVSSLDMLKDKGYVIYMSPKGTPLTQDKAVQLSKNKTITIICGRYEGIDQRIIDNYIDEEISIGDYVLTGGELPAMVLIDTITRLEPGVLKEEAYIDESHYNGLLEHCQYTRPSKFEGFKTPDILLSGNHKLIEEYKLESSLVETYLKRKDLLLKRGISKIEAEILIKNFSDKKDDIIKLIKE